MKTKDKQYALEREDQENKVATLEIGMSIKVISVYCACVCMLIALLITVQTVIIAVGKCNSLVGQIFSHKAVVLSDP